MHVIGLTMLGSILGLVAAESLLSAPVNGKLVHLAGHGTGGIACRLEQNPVVPLVGIGSHVQPRDVVLAIDRGSLHFRYGLVWETPKHQALGASAAAWARDDPAPAYLHISGTTAARRAGQTSFIVFLPAGEHEAIRAEVDVHADGSAALNSRSLALVAEGPAR